MSKKISELTAATTPLAGTESVEIVQGGTSKKVAVSYLGGGSSGREMLSSNRTYYVRTDGSDSNNGLANTSGGAFLTIQKCIDVVCSTLDINAGVVVTCQVADGTYTGANVMKQLIGAGRFVIQGNSGTPDNVIISVTSGDCFQNVIGGAELTVKDMKLTTTTSGSCLIAANSSYIKHSNINFGSCANNHCYGIYYGRVEAVGNYKISGSAQAHEIANRLGSVVVASRTITITGTPSFSSSYSSVSTLGYILNYSSTFSGSAAGKRYSATLNGVIDVLGASSTYLPGDVSGTTATGGQYA